MGKEREEREWEEGRRCRERRREWGNIRDRRCKGGGGVELGKWVEWGGKVRKENDEGKKHGVD